MSEAAGALGKGANYEVSLFTHLEKCRNFIDLVLAIGIHGDDRLISVLSRVTYASLHTTPSAYWQDGAKYLCTVRLCDVCCFIGALVIDYQNVVPAHGAKARQYLSDGQGLVTGGNNDEQIAAIFC
ncbi:hypothetical protein ASD75_22665 [Acidovorax sp. Root568]|nr:hypothetical protein ASD75_22665 [Acidovorax sp. Root568]